ncbi:ATP-binding cassette domain-containing protein [Natrialba asiatica]|uniref:ABC transporter n=1 Tax=Natrialba asiatica (strain ATCC 700177 / DSM 12278 / JCM 9576 / FERM P-10747 / NBRC 102637 / 172P1) TaxID=29540 RepID=M0B527_NATA1|nr:ATP-binding cassette domain-containing protein [Natrialba asiatica]ELZ05991.1 ABC transporter [Natrialba asiatica DSM 12278]
MNSETTDIADDAPASGKTEPKIAVDDVRKVFGRIVALEDVNLTVRENEIFAVVGDNGAGKSTLMNVLCGIHGPTTGSLRLDGRPVAFESPDEARARGIETVYQDLALMDDLDVATNIFMGNFPERRIGPVSLIDWEETYRRAERIIETHLERTIDPRAEVAFHSGGERQLVAIARALAFDPDVVILDEPTSALSVDATELVQDTVRTLQRNGKTIVIVSHSLDEIFGLADRVGVLYQGRMAAIMDADDVSKAELSSLMVSGERP